MLQQDAVTMRTKTGLVRSQVSANDTKVLALPTKVWERIVSQVNGALDRPVPSLFEGNKLACRVAGRLIPKRRWGAAGTEWECFDRDGTLERRLLTAEPDAPDYYRHIVSMVAFDEGRYQVQFARGMDSMWSEIRVTAKDDNRVQGNVRPWPQPVRLGADFSALVDIDALKQAVATVATGGEIDPGLCMLRPDWQLRIDVDLSKIPMCCFSCADVLLPHGFHVKARAAYVCSSCGRFQHRLHRCPRCKHAHYCDRECQTEDWEQHKHECRLFR